MMTAMARPKLFLIDTFGFIFRAYHARARSGAPPMRTTTGISTEAVYIFHNMLRKLLTTYKPAYITAIWESSVPTFRSEIVCRHTKPTAPRCRPIWPIRSSMFVSCWMRYEFPFSKYPGFEATT